MLNDVLTDDNISETFDVPLIVEQSGNRWTARLRQD
jgi:hypothetical protein